MKDLMKKRRIYIEKLKIIRFVAEILNFVGADENLLYNYYVAERNLTDEVFLIDEMMASIKKNFRDGFIKGYGGYGENYIKKLDDEELIQLNDIIEKSFNNTYWIERHYEGDNDSFENRREALIRESVDEIVKLALGMVSEKNQSILQ